MNCTCTCEMNCLNMSSQKRHETNSVNMSNHIHLSVIQPKSYFYLYSPACKIPVNPVTPVNCFSGYIYNFASSASKKLSESVVETAQNLKKSVEEGKINGIIDKVSTSWFLILPFYWNKTFYWSKGLAIFTEILFLPSDHIGGFPEGTTEVCAGEKRKTVW